MQTTDWIVVGNGIAGAALSYELAKRGQSVLLIDDAADSATRYSYGGIAYWSGTDAMTRELMAAGIARHRTLSEELGADTEFRELDLLLTIPAGADMAAVQQPYQKFERPPQLISATEACELEPQLNRDAIAGALTVKHGHVHPTKTVAAFNHAFRQLGGRHLMSSVTGLVRVGNQVTGVMTPSQAYVGGQVAISAGGYTRSILQSIGLNIPLYHTHAEVVDCPQVEAQLRTLIMPALADRFKAEAIASAPETEPLWQAAEQEIAPPILDAGVVQFKDGFTRIGQISRFHTAVELAVDQAASEAKLRRAMGEQMPALETAPGTWHHCLVTFSRDGLPLVGAVPNLEGLQLFSGFTSPFAMLLPIAERFAQFAAGEPNGLIEKMQLRRFL
ncbi:MAG: FAD-binding oxidoreductase [Cyanobacteria bacterium P01_A01_bin.105]